MPRTESETARLGKEGRDKPFVFNQVMSGEDNNIENGLTQTEGMDTQDPNAQAGGDITENDDERFVIFTMNDNPPLSDKFTHL